MTLSGTKAHDFIHSTFSAKGGYTFSQTISLTDSYEDRLIKAYDL